jgi:hypothetical protein
MAAVGWQLQLKDVIASRICTVVDRTCYIFFVVYGRVQTTCGEDTQKCNFSDCFPECEDSVFSEMSVAYRTTRIPRSEFYMYLQVWIVILKCTCKCELWASLMYKTFLLCGLYLVFFLWFAGFVMSLLEQSFQCKILFLPTYLVQ